MGPVIEIVVSKTGEIKADGRGFKDKSCLKAMDFLKRLGKFTKKLNKVEATKEPEVANKLKIGT